MALYEAEHCNEHIAEMLRECADALDAKDAEITRLGAHVDRLQESDDALGTIHGICHDAGIAEGHAVERVRVLAGELSALRAAVLALPEYEHHPVCDAEGPPELYLECDCGADAANAACAAARKLAGLEG